MNDYSVMERLRKCCRELIEICASDSRFIPAAAESATEARTEKLCAFLEAGIEYGVYRKIAMPQELFTGKQTGLSMP